MKKFWSSILIITISALFLKYGIRPPLPSQLFNTFMVVIIISVLLYVSCSEKSFQEFLHPIKATLAEEEKRWIRMILFILFPIFVGFYTYQKTAPHSTPPTELRTIHPAPPAQIQFRGKTIVLQGLENPLRKDGKDFDKFYQKGFEVYAKYCVHCHGANLDGNGPFASALNPPPANFRDSGTIAQLQESYLFWRIAKGGPGLPPESAPWSSAMPSWEDTLNEEEIWSVILYLYEAAGVKPRTWE